MPLCKNPYMAGSLPCPCGKCIPCLINRKRLWKHRILLESYSHENSAFVTLTYEDENLSYICPETGEILQDATLDPSHYQKFLKRLRRSIAPQRLRFYAVGEYGDRSWRPHYHLALFGYEPCWHGQTRKDKHSKGRSCCPPCDAILKAWSDPKTKKPYGGIDNARIEPESAGYIAGYVTKKLTKKGDEKLNGRFPEFSRKSNRPGLGALNVEKLADTLFSEFGKDALTEHGDVPISLNHGGRSFPLGRYLRDKLREAIGVNEATKEKAIEAYIQEMQVLFNDYLNDPKVPKDKKTSLKTFVQDKDAQKILNVETKHKLKGNRK